MPTDAAERDFADNAECVMPRRSAPMFQFPASPHAYDMSATATVAALRKELDAFAWDLVSRLAPRDTAEAEIPLDTDDSTR
jgi:hypothetical protein